SGSVSVIKVGQVTFTIVGQVTLYFPLYNELQFFCRIPLLVALIVFYRFTGLAYVDIYRLYPHHIGISSDGRKYIREKRGKTNVEAFVPLHPIAERILALYNTTDYGKPVFPLPKRDGIWHEIHGMGVGLGLKENLSYHQARHSFGTLLLSSGISIESISKMMGHSNISSTQVYAKVTDDKISEDMDKLMAKRSGNGTCSQ
uniref:site-specific integrase n=1 Tax=Bacteroides finegoldii TaxID=338188 RepID=UPI003561D3E6